MPYQFKQGDKVIYVPTYAKGDVTHPACEKGIVSSVRKPIDDGPQRVWVRYDEGETGQLTHYDNLVLVS